MWSSIVPLVKAKGGNMQHISNYRATALSNASSTIFELVFKPYLKNEDPCDMYHFGFAPQLSTRVCTTTFKLCIECYTQHGSHIFALYISQKHSTLLFIADFSITYYMIRLTAILSTYFHTGTSINKPVSNANMYIPPIYSLEMILGKEAFCHLTCFRDIIVT
jgi:hypothetical protein